MKKSDTPNGLSLSPEFKEPEVIAISACFQVRPEPFGQSRTLIVEALNESNLQNQDKGDNHRIAKIEFNLSYGVHKS